MVTLIVDEVEVTVAEGTTILEAAQQAGIYIPHLCSHPDLPPVEALKPAEVVYRGDVRIENKRPDLEYEGCQLCVVEIEGEEEPKRACSTKAMEGMVVHTDTPQLQDFRQERLKFLLAKHPHACLTCAQKEGCARFPCSMNVPENERCCVKFGRCELQKIAEYVGISPDTPRYVFEDLPIIKDEPLLERNYNLCIGCTRCIRVCSEVRGVSALGFVFDEEGRVVVGTVAPTLRESACRFCTACVEVCPTGALLDKKPFEEAPCRAACPVGIDVPRYVHLIAEGKFDESYAVVREKLPLPSVCSYICLSFCEAECRRGEVNEAVAIRALKRFVSENHSDFWKRNLKEPTSTGKRVAILGSGPTGLTTGYYLTRKGHEVTIFEQASLPGGMLRQAVSRKRLPKKALEEDIEEILQAGVNLKLNSPRMQIGELLEEGFDAIVLATGSTFVGPPALWLKGEGIELTPVGSVAAAPDTLVASRKGVFAGGDVVLGGISEDFIRCVDGPGKDNFFNLVVDQLTRHRGDSSRSAIKAIASGRKAAEAVDKYLGGDGVIDEPLLPAEETNHWLGRVEGFADLERLSASYHAPPPQFAGLDKAELPLTLEAAIGEAKRCLRCDLRLLLSKVILPPKVRLWVEFNPENVATVPELEGVYQLLDEGENVMYIKGAMNLRQELQEELDTRENAKYFMYREEPMYTKRESELLQQYMIEHGQMPEGNRELEDLF
ncbi:MAG: 2Fe-2S iron-sulfur cluster-binding protein [Chloroflexota bacterium]|nr:2Fe-2S iron-sulfur cluster-binding protein [Chloroflexota bacterium]